MGVVKKIAVLTSGGDSPGMNAAVRAVTRRALKLGIEVMGSKRGYRGLLDDDLIPLNRGDVSNIIQAGGSILISSRCEEFYTPEGRAEAFKNCKKRNIDALIVIGGNGSMKGAHLLQAETGLKIVGLPGTIDNDLYGTEWTIGFDTAVNTALDAIDKIRDTASAMERTFFIEVMGRHCGNIALHAGVAGGADYVAIPEKTTHIEKLCDLLRHGMQIGKRTNIVVVAEGDDVGGAQALADKVRQCSGIKSWVCKLGHIQRGGSPTARDRFLATLLGMTAVEDLQQGKTGHVLGIWKNAVSRTPLKDVAEKSKPFNEEIYSMLGLQE